MQEVILVNENDLLLSPKAIEVSLDLAWLTTSLSATMPTALRGGVVLVGLRPCVEALARFHALGGDACLCEKSVCKTRYLKYQSPSHRRS